MLARLRKAHQENEGGFTLIELLVVVIIIGILAAIAIPTFLNQREKAWERAALSDLRNGAVVLEEQFSDTGAYTGLATTDFKNSEGVSFDLAGVAATAYCIEAAHTKLTGKTFVLNSADGVAKAGACP